MGARDHRFSCIIHRGLPEWDWRSCDLEGGASSIWEQEGADRDVRFGSLLHGHWKAPQRDAQDSTVCTAGAIGAAPKSVRGPRQFARLYYGGETGDYPSASEADLALCRALAFWSGGDRERIDRLFRKSGLMR